MKQFIEHSFVCMSGSTAAGDVEALYFKIAKRIIPFLALLFVMAWLDRYNLGFAKLQMAKDLGFSETVYGFGAGIVYFGYMLFEIPSNLLLERIGARKTFARITILWGITSIRDDVCEDRGMVLCSAFPPRLIRGRFVSGRGLLPDVLVPRPAPCADAGAFYNFHPAFRHPRRRHFRLDHGLSGRPGRPRQLAMALPARGHPVDRCGSVGAGHRGGQAKPGALAF